MSELRRAIEDAHDKVMGEFTSDMRGVVEHTAIVKTPILHDTCGRVAFYYIGAFPEIEEAILRYPMASTDFEQLDGEKIIPGSRFECGSCGRIIPGIFELSVGEPVLAIIDSCEV